MLFLCLIYTLRVADAIFLDNSATRPPKITLFSTNKTVLFKPKSAVQLVCEAEGNPTPVYKWYRNGYLFIPSGNDNRVVQLPGKGTLLFWSAEEKDEGTYQCMADNGYGVSLSSRVDFRAAKSSQFSWEPLQNHYVQNGDALTLNCVPPYSYPPATLTWVLQNNDGSWQPIQMDGRITMDLEGRLRILSLELADDQGDRPYSCKATNTFLRQSVIGPGHTVKVLGSIPQRRPVYEYWSSPSQLKVLRGDELKMALICAGNPISTTHWYKLDGTKTLPDRATFTNDQIIIPNADVQDNGVYKAVCISTDYRPVEKNFTITVEAAPSWKTKPNDVNVYIGSNATIVCEAEGIPTPWVYWFVNGVGVAKTNDPRVLSSRFQQVNGSAVVFTNLQITDRMNIQCNATNRNGYLWGEAYIDVK